MTRQPHPDPSPFFLKGGPLGVLLIHGFTGSPPEMRLIGDYLHARGCTVSAPLLPGHGTTEQDMNRHKWVDWTAHVETALSDLESQCQTVFVGGLSMGALLTLHLAARHPDLSGAVLYSPAVKIASRLIYLSPLLKHVVASRPKSGDSDLTDPQAELRLWSYERNPTHAAHELLKLNARVRRGLPQVKCPLLIVQSTRDRTIKPDSARFTYEHVGTPVKDRELFTLHNSGHCLTVDSEWEFVAQRTHEFLIAHSSA